MSSFEPSALGSAVEQEIERPLLIARVERRERLARGRASRFRPAPLERDPRGEPVGGEAAGNAPRSSSASSASPRAYSIRASGTAASARRGSSSSARRSDCSSPLGDQRVGLGGQQRVEERARPPPAAARRRTRRRPSPSRNALTAGMLWIRNVRAMIGLASTSTLASSILPARSATARSITGPSWRHGPHHSAQKSTTTGSVCDRSMTADWKVLSVTSIPIDGSQGVSAADRLEQAVVAEQMIEGAGVRLGRRGRGRGDPGRAPPRPDRDQALRGDGLEVARAIRPPGDRLRRPRPRTLLAGTGSGRVRLRASWARDLEAVLDALGVRRAVLAGASMGAHTALWLALQRPGARGGAWLS